MNATAEGRLALVWRLIGYFVAWFAVMVVTNQLRLSEDGAAAGPQAWNAALYISGVLAVTWVFRRFVDRRPWAGIGLPGPQGRWGQMAAGALLAMGLLFATFGVLVAIGAVQVTGFGSLASAWEPLLAYALVHLAVGVTEELCFRGYLFVNLAERFPAGSAAVGLGLFFGLLHFEHAASLLDYLVIVVAGTAVTVLFTLGRLVTGSLWFPIAFHMAWNWTEAHLLGLSGSESAGVVLLTRTGSPAQYNPVLNLVELVLILLAIGGLVWWSARAGRPIGWRRRLGPEGEAVERGA
jgi:uncharacterized protein